MRALFTVHGGEFLVGDHINRRLGKQHDVWVPTKDSGLDLLVTDKRRKRKPVALQVKFSRGYSLPDEAGDAVAATSWFKLDPRKIRSSAADVWVFVILTLARKAHFVLVPTKHLMACIPSGVGTRWDLYLWVTRDDCCYQVRDLRKRERLESVHLGVQDRKRDFSKWLNNWKLLSGTR